MNDEIYEQIVNLCNKANEEIEEENYDEALVFLNKALELVPESKEDWDTSTWIYATMGDTLFLDKKYSEALITLKQAFKCYGGITNPFILLRLGQCYFELNQTDNAKEFLLRAYMLEGKEIFKVESDKYYQLITDLIGG